jgi:hypothetical protein
MQIDGSDKSCPMIRLKFLPYQPITILKFLLLADQTLWVFCSLLQ